MPVRRFVLQPLAARRGQPVVTRAPVVFAGAPFAVDQTVAFEALKGDQERPGIDFENTLADLLDALRHAEAVHWLQAQTLQDEHVEGALDDVGGRHSESLLLMSKRI